MSARDDRPGPGRPTLPEPRRDPDGVDDELAFHLDQVTSELIAGGWEPGAARAEARRRFADLEATRRYCKRMDRRWSRRQRLAAALDGWRQEVRFAFRQLRRSPGFAFATVLTLSLGIGSVTGIFALVDAVLLEPLPYHEPDRLVRIQDTGPRFEGRRVNVNPANFRDWQAAATSFEGMAGFTPARLTLTADGTAELVPGAWMTAGLLEVLGVPPVLGREPLPAEDVPGAEAPVAVISHGAWTARFGSDPDVVGRTVLLEGTPYEIVGVAPPELRLPDLEPSRQPEFLLPGGFGEPNGRGGHWLRAVGRLGPGVGLERARQEMAAVASSLAEQHPDVNEGVEVHLEPLHESEVGASRAVLYLFLGAVGLLLLIACVNVAGLFLIRNLGRAREFGVRAALGAGRGRVLRQLTAEASVMAALGTVGGVMVAWTVTTWLPRMPGLDLPRLEGVGLDAGVLAVAAGLALVASLAAVWIPARAARERDPATGLRAGTAGGGRRHAAVEALAVVEVALSVMLLVGAGILARSYLTLSAVDPGFDPEGAAVVRIVVPESVYDDQERADLYRRILAEVRALPGVVAAGAGDSPPFQNAQNSRTSYTIPGAPPPDPSEPRRMAWEEYATPGYFEALGIPLLQGRGFRESDRRDAAPVAVVNRAFVERSWPDGAAVGRRFGYNGSEWEVVGVVENGLRRGLDDRSEPEMVFPPDQHPWWVPSAVFIAVRSAGDPAASVGPVRDVVRRIAPDVPVGLSATMESLVSETLAPARFRGLLVGAFAVLAGSLALLGVYAVLAYRVTLRRREIGVRMALGADRASVLGMVLRRGLLLAGAGAALGAVGSWISGGLLAGFVYGVEPGDPATLAVVLVAFLGAAAAAAWIPARRATGLDPVTTLNSE